MIIVPIDSPGVQIRPLYAWSDYRGRSHRAGGVLWTREPRGRTYRPANEGAPI